MSIGNVTLREAQAGLNLLRRRALVTTVTDEKPIAPAASMGFSRMPKNGKSTPAATGIRITL